MNINDIFLKRKKRWGTINRLRDSEEQSDGSLTPSRRIALISDDKSFRELYAQVKTGNPNSFPGYEKKVEANRLKTGQQDAVVTGTCRIGGVKTAVAVMDKRFLMGSMGIAVGEKITRLTEYAMKRKLPLIIFAASVMPCSNRNSECWKPSGSFCRKAFSRLCRWQRQQRQLKSSRMLGDYLYHISLIRQQVV